MSFRLLSLVAVVLCLGTAACTDDDPVRPQKFAVTVKVVDAAGAPVEGLLMSVTSDNPYLQDGRSAKAATIIPFQMPVPAIAELTIADIEGLVIRRLVDQAVPAGVHQVVWDGRDQDAVRQHSGRYTARLVLRDLETDAVLFSEATDMLMCILDPVRSPVGQTDQAGRIVLTDRRLFPHLYDKPAMNAVDENGEIAGALTPTAAMIFTLADTANGGAMVFREEVDGPLTMEFVWNAKPRDQVVRGETMPGGPVVPPLEFRLGPVFPNPFN
jgi:hypothetical protein